MPTSIPDIPPDNPTDAVTETVDTRLPENKQPIDAIKSAIHEQQVLRFVAFGEKRKVDFIITTNEVPTEETRERLRQQSTLPYAGSGRIDTRPLHQAALAKVDWDHSSCDDLTKMHVNTQVRYDVYKTFRNID